MRTQKIYFDEVDDARDGRGWNIVDGDEIGGVALRFDDVRTAVRWCQENGASFSIDGDVDGLGLDYVDGQGWVIV